MVWQSVRPLLACLTHFLCDEDGLPRFRYESPNRQGMLLQIPRVPPVDAPSFAGRLQEFHRVQKALPEIGKVQMVLQRQF